MTIEEGKPIFDEGLSQHVNNLSERGSLSPTRDSKTSTESLRRGLAIHGQGSACYLYFGNEVFSNFGEWIPPFITLGHELIHCIHSLRGQEKVDIKEEEWFTVGLKHYEKAEFTENKLRLQALLPPREKYFQND